MVNDSWYFSLSEWYYSINRYIIVLLDNQIAVEMQSVSKLTANWQNINICHIKVDFRVISSIPNG